MTQTTNYEGAICKGSYSLGTACGMCVRCDRERESPSFAQIMRERRANRKISTILERYNRGDCKLGFDGWKEMMLDLSEEIIREAVDRAKYG